MFFSVFRAKITNPCESARFAGVFCNRHRYCFVIAVGAGSARPNMIQNYRLHKSTQIKILIIWEICGLNSSDKDAQFLHSPAGHSERKRRISKSTCWCWDPSDSFVPINRQSSQATLLFRVAIRMTGKDPVQDDLAVCYQADTMVCPYKVLMFSPLGEG